MAIHRIWKAIKWSTELSLQHNFICKLPYNFWHTETFTRSNQNTIPTSFMLFARKMEGRLSSYFIFPRRTEFTLCRKNVLGIYRAFNEMAGRNKYSLLRIALWNCDHYVDKSKITIRRLFYNYFETIDSQSLNRTIKIRERNAYRQIYFIRYINEVRKRRKGEKSTTTWSKERCDAMALSITFSVFTIPYSVLGWVRAVP